VDLRADGQRVLGDMHADPVGLSRRGGGVGGYQRITIRNSQNSSNCSGFSNVKSVLGIWHRVQGCGYRIRCFGVWVFGYLDAEDSWWRGNNGGFFSYEVESVRQVKALRREFEISGSRNQRKAQEHGTWGLAFGVSSLGSSKWKEEIRPRVSELRFGIFEMEGENKT